MSYIPKISVLINGCETCGQASPCSCNSGQYSQAAVQSLPEASVPCTEDGCPISVGTNCVLYDGPDYDFLGIKKGDTMLMVLNILFNKIKDLS